jgi:hypothetical protein
MRLLYFFFVRTSCTILFSVSSAFQPLFYWLKPVHLECLKSIFKERQTPKQSSFVSSCRYTITSWLPDWLASLQRDISNGHCWILLNMVTAGYGWTLGTPQIEHVQIGECCQRALRSHMRWHILVTCTNKKRNHTQIEVQACMQRYRTKRETVRDEAPSRKGLRYSVISKLELVAARKNLRVTGEFSKPITRFRTSSMVLRKDQKYSMILVVHQPGL